MSSRASEHLGAVRGLRLLCLSCVLLMLSGCDGFGIGDDDDSVLALVTDEGEVRVLGGSDDNVETTWTSSISASAHAPLVVSGSSIYVGSGTALARFSLQDGSAPWTQVELPSDVLTLVSPSDDRVIVLNFNEIMGFDGDSGATLWTRNVLDDLLGVADSALDSEGGVVALGGDPTRLLDAETGNDFAEHGTGTTAVADVVLDGGSVFIGLATGVIAVDSETADAQWAVSTAAAVDGLTVSGGLVFYSTLGGGLGILDRSNGEILGTAEPGEAFRDVAAAGDVLLAARSDGTLLAYDTALDEIWRQEGASSFGGLAAGSRNVYYASGGAVEALSLEAGDYLWQRDYPGAVVSVQALD